MNKSLILLVLLALIGSLVVSSVNAKTIAKKRRRFGLPAAVPKCASGYRLKKQCRRVRMRCSCRSRAFKKCGNGITGKPLKCRKRFIARCKRRCKKKRVRCRMRCKFIGCRRSEKKRVICNRRSCACSKKAAIKCGSGRRNSSCRRRVISSCRRRCGGCRVLCERRRRCDPGQVEVRKCRNGRCKVKCSTCGCPSGQQPVKLCKAMSLSRCFKRSVENCGRGRDRWSRRCRRRNMRRCKRRMKRGSCRTVCRKSNPKVPRGFIETKKCKPVSCKCEQRASLRCGTGSERRQNKCRRRFVRRCNRRCRKRRACSTSMKPICRRGYVSKRVCVKKVRKCSCRSRAFKKCGYGITGKPLKCRKRFIARCKRRCKSVSINCRNVCSRKCSPAQRETRRCSITRRGRKVCRSVCKSRCGKGFRFVKECRKTEGSRLSCRNRCVKRCQTGQQLKTVCAVRKCRSCRHRATRKCGNGTRQSDANCRRRYMAVCRKRCKQKVCKKVCMKKRCPRGYKLSSKCKSVRKGCNCGMRAVRNCGASSKRSARMCRLLHKKNCQARCRKLAKQPKCGKVCLKRRIVRKKCCYTAALRKCGRKADRKSYRCRNKEVAKCRRRAKVPKGCRCRARAIKRCGVSKNPAAKRCRRTVKRRCYRRCVRKRACRSIIIRKCKQHKRGSLARKKCVRSVAKKHCTRKKLDRNSCRCKALARKRCGKGVTPKAIRCQDDQYDKCRRRCTKRTGRFCVNHKGKRRCFRNSCRDAAKDCAAVVEGICSLAANKAFCKKSQMKKCKRRKYALCKKFRRRLTFRKSCHKVSLVKCGKHKTQRRCRAVYVQKCVNRKCKQYHSYKRKHMSCHKRSLVICSSKRGTAGKLCRTRHRRRCLRRETRRKYIRPKECVTKCTTLCGGNNRGKCFRSQMKRCVSKWLKGYCENESYYKCDAHVGCMKLYIKKCKKRLPKCWMNRKLCDDNNKCTRDICHPKKGCLNIRKRCHDNNKCTVDTCDPKKGCVHTAIKCNDKVACTKDYCDRATGSCRYKKMHSRCASKDKCVTGVCTRKGCLMARDSKCHKRRVEDLCKVCKPRHPCEKVKCHVNKNLKVTCSRKNKKCDDGYACTTDSCDKKTGRCVYNFKKTSACTTTCRRDSDCAEYAVENRLMHYCQVAVCDRFLGACKPVKVSSKEKGMCTPKKECSYKCVEESVRKCGSYTRDLATCERVARCRIARVKKCTYTCEKKRVEEEKEKLKKIQEKIKKEKEQSEKEKKRLEELKKEQERLNKLKEKREEEKRKKTLIEERLKLEEKKKELERLRITKEKERLKKIEEERQKVIKQIKQEQEKKKKIQEEHRKYLIVLEKHRKQREILRKKLEEQKKKKHTKIVIVLKKKITVIEKQIKKEREGKDQIKNKIVKEDEVLKNLKKVLETSKKVSKEVKKDIVQLRKDIKKLKKTVQKKKTTLQELKKKKTTQVVIKKEINVNKKKINRVKKEIQNMVEKILKDKKDKKHIVVIEKHLEKIIKKETIIQKENNQKKNVGDQKKRQEYIKQIKLIQKLIKQLLRQKEILKQQRENTIQELVEIKKEIRKTVFIKEKLYKKYIQKLYKESNELVEKSKEEEKNSKENSSKLQKIVKISKEYEQQIKIVIIKKNQQEFTKLIQKTQLLKEESSKVVKKMEQSMETSKKHLEQLKKVYKHYETELKVVEKQITQLQKEIKKSNIQLQTTKKTERKYHRMEHENKQKKVTLKIITEIQVVTKKVVKQVEKLTKLMKEENSKEEKMVEQIKKIFEQIKKLHEKTTKVNKETKKEDLEKLQKEREDLENKIKKLIEESNKTEKTKKNLKEQLEKLKEEIKKVTEQIKKLYEEKEKNKQDFKNKKEQDDKEAREKEAKKQKEQLDKLKKKIEDLQKKMKEDEKKKRENSTKKQKEKDDDKRQKKEQKKKDKKKKEEKTTEELNKKEKKESEKKIKHECDSYRDCTKSRFGGVCTPGKDGVKKCRQHTCRTDLNCLSKVTDENQWGYCKVNKYKQKVCKFRPKCINNKDCDDQDPCTKDVCLKKYGYCFNHKRCVDNDQCTHDICVPQGKDKYYCKNPIKSCTIKKDLLTQYSQITRVPSGLKEQWKGKCSHQEGCVTCVVNAQCSDNNGCTADSCEKQFCLHRPIHNEWCDPKLSTQPITFQSLPQLREGPNGLSPNLIKN